MDKKIYKRLNDYTVLCIYKYTDEVGYRYDRIVVHYEDTNENVEFGTYRVNKGLFNSRTTDTYSYNNNYIIGYKYERDKECLRTNRLYDINNRCDILNDDKFHNYYCCIRVEEDIEQNKYKTLSLVKKYKKI